MRRRSCGEDLGVREDHLVIAIDLGVGPTVARTAKPLDVKPMFGRIPLVVVALNGAPYLRPAATVLAAFGLDDLPNCNGMTHGHASSALLWPLGLTSGQRGNSPRFAAAIASRAAPRTLALAAVHAVPECGPRAAHRMHLKEAEPISILAAMPDLRLALRARAVDERDAPAARVAEFHAGVPAAAMDCGSGSGGGDPDRRCFTLFTFAILG